MKKGYVRLYNKSGDEMYDRRYESATDRRKIIDGWVKMYGPAFSSCYIHIVPEINFDDTTEAGLNKQTWHYHNKRISKYS